MNDYKVFKQIGGRKTYVAVEIAYPIQTESQAIEIAKKYLKESRNNLICEAGRVIGNDLYLKSTKGKYPTPLCVENYDVWVVYRK